MKNRIKEYREKKGLSQGKLAEECNVSRQTINAIENNKYDPSLQLAFDIARTLGVTMEKLFLAENGGKKDWIKQNSYGSFSLVLFSITYFLRRILNDDT